jgi:hypothetical protein
MATKLRKIINKVKSNASSAQKYVPGATLNKPTLPSLKTLGISGANLVGSVLPVVNAATQVYNATKPKTTSTQTPLPRNYSSTPYNPNVPNMSVVPKASTTQFQTLNRLEGQMQTPNPDYGVYQTQAPKTSYSSGNTVTQPVQPTGPVAYNRNYSSSNNTVGSSSSPVGSSPMSRSSVSSSPSISGSPTISPAGVTTPIGATTGGTMNTPDGANTQYDYSLTPEERALEEARKRETEYYDKLANERISRDEIMRDTLAQFQGEIDATNSVFADKLRQAQIQGQNRLGMTRAENFNAGIENSSFANAAQERTANFNTDAENAIQNEKLQMISQIESSAREAGQKFYEQKKAAKEAGLESYMALLTGTKSAKEAIALDIADNILNSNLSIDEINPQNLESIAKNAGVTTSQIKKLYQQRLDEQAQAEAELALKGQFNLSEGQARYERDPITGEVKLMASRGKTYAPGSGGSGTGSNGIYDQLDYRTANAVIAQGNQFGTSDVVKKYNNIIAASNLIAGVDPNTQNPAEHQAVIYNFAKALDPDSVVREGEYATVKKYSQSLINKYGGEIRQAIKGTGFLSPGAIKAIQGATDNRIKAYEPQYINLRNQTAQRINTLAGKPVADSVLLDYEQGYTGNQNASSDTDFGYLENKIRIDKQTKKAYLSRSEWDNVADKDALLSEAEADGYELLID